jgi:hypothetical protein
MKNKILDILEVALYVATGFIFCNVIYYMFFAHI